MILFFVCGCFGSFVVLQTFQTITNREKEGKGGERIVVFLATLNSIGGMDDDDEARGRGVERGHERTG